MVGVCTVCLQVVSVFSMEQEAGHYPRVSLGGNGVKSSRKIVSSLECRIMGLHPGPTWWLVIMNLN